MRALAREVRAGRVDTVLLVFPDLYGRLMGKRLDADFFLESGGEGTHACDYLLTVDMEMEPVQGYRYSNWQTGYGDFHMAPDLSTLRRASWLDRTVLVVCDILDPRTHERVAVAPRTILRRQIERAARLGYRALAASELEYYIFRDSFREAAERGYQGLRPAGWYIEDYHALQGTREETFNGAARRHLKASGIPVENSKGEWGKGQHELNIRYEEVLEMADRHVVFKQCLKEIAEAQGISVTFMAKPHEDQAGSSCHVHLSLWRGDRNAFPGRRKMGPVQTSDAFRWFLGGWIARVPEMMVFYASTVNAYKRYKPGSWAPTRLAWSYDNRTAGFRVVGRASQDLRIECRIPGADCNPYLVYAAALASGLDGIARKTEPPPMFEGDAYTARDVPHVPRSLPEATEIFALSRFAREAFGEDAVEHYAHFFRTEQAAFHRAVTDWERRRYFERI
ncbi:MAG: glutamine synthetase [Nitrospirae bacterium]|nr:glutamine synthetase [Nitrospirota bacterium]